MLKQIFLEMMGKESDLPADTKAIINDLVNRMDEIYKGSEDN